FVERVPGNGKDRFERAVREISEVIRICEQQGLEGAALFAERLLRNCLRLANSLLQFVIHISSLLGESCDVLETAIKRSDLAVMRAAITIANVAGLYATYAAANSARTSGTVRYENSLDVDRARTFTQIDSRPRAAAEASADRTIAANCGTHGAMSCLTVPASPSRTRAKNIPNNIASSAKQR